MDEDLQKNLEILRQHGKRDDSFGPVYVQRLCKIGYHQAVKTIDLGLQQGIFQHDPDCDWRYCIAQ